MKKIITAVLAGLLILVSCDKNLPDNEDTLYTPKSDFVQEDISDVITEPISEEPIVPEDPQPALPKTAEEIIAFANSLEVSDDIALFTLVGLLDGVIPEKTEDAGDSYQNSTVYLGDSTTLGLKHFGNHPKELVIAAGSTDPQSAVNNKLIQLEDGSCVSFPEAVGLISPAPQRIVLTFGTNAVAWMQEELFIKYYGELIDAVQAACPDSQIIIQSIPPLADFCTKKTLTNPVINRSNVLLLVLAYSRGLPFFDTASALKGDDGYMVGAYASSDDGIHINYDAYEVWIEYLRCHKV